jgi:hypothetical protein
MVGDPMGRAVTWPIGNVPTSRAPHPKSSNWSRAAGRVRLTCTTPDDTGASPERQGRHRIAGCPLVDGGDVLQGVERVHVLVEHALELALDHRSDQRPTRRAPARLRPGISQPHQLNRPITLGNRRIQTPRCVSGIDSRYSSGPFSPVPVPGEDVHVPGCGASSGVSVPV